jgi:hypothetical protein
MQPLGFSYKVTYKQIDMKAKVENEEEHINGIENGNEGGRKKIKSV